MDTIDSSDVRRRIQAVHDTMYVLSGEWKISILASLCFGVKRFSEILRDVDGISGKVLSRELKDMEMNLLIKRTVLNTHPVTIQYEITEYCDMLIPIIHNLSEWGIKHRKKIIER